MKEKINNFLYLFLRHLLAESDYGIYQNQKKQKNKKIKKNQETENL